MSECRILSQLWGGNVRAMTFLSLWSASNWLWTSTESKSTGRSSFLSSNSSLALLPSFLFPDKLPHSAKPLFFSATDSLTQNGMQLRNKWFAFRNNSSHIWTVHQIKFICQVVGTSRIRIGQVRQVAWYAVIQKTLRETTQHKDNINSDYNKCGFTCSEYNLVLCSELLEVESIQLFPL